MRLRLRSIVLVTAVASLFAPMMGWPVSGSLILRVRAPGGLLPRVLAVKLVPPRRLVVVLPAWHASWAVTRPKYKARRNGEFSRNPLVPVADVVNPGGFF